MTTKPPTWEEEWDKICPAKCEVFIGKEKIVCDFNEYVPKLKDFIRQLIQKEREKWEKSLLTNIEDKIPEVLEKERANLIKELLEKMPKEMRWIQGEALLHIQIADGYNQAISEIKSILNKLK